MRHRARVVGTSNGAYRDPAAGDVSDLDYFVLSDCLASVLSQPLRTSQFPPRNHYVAEASLGPQARAHQTIRVLRGPRPFPRQPTASLRKDLEDVDGEPHYTALRGDPGLSWVELMRGDSLR
eukprot:4575379-Pyramimonas_sp.AAC.1